MSGNRSGRDASGQARDAKGRRRMASRCFYIERAVYDLAVQMAWRRDLGVSALVEAALCEYLGVASPHAIGGSAESCD